MPSMGGISPLAEFCGRRRSLLSGHALIPGARRVLHFGVEVGGNLIWRDSFRSPVHQSIPPAAIPAKGIPPRIRRDFQAPTPAWGICGQGDTSIIGKSATQRPSDQDSGGEIAEWAGLADRHIRPNGLHDGARVVRSVKAGRRSKSQEIHQRWPLDKLSPVPIAPLPPHEWRSCQTRSWGCLVSPPTARFRYNPQSHPGHPAGPANL